MSDYSSERSLPLGELSEGHGLHLRALARTSGGIMDLSVVASGNDPAPELRSYEAGYSPSFLRAVYGNHRVWLSGLPITRPALVKSFKPVQALVRRTFPDAQVLMVRDGSEGSGLCIGASHDVQEIDLDGRKFVQAPIVLAVAGVRVVVQALNVLPPVTAYSINGGDPIPIDR